MQNKTLIEGNWKHNLNMIVVRAQQSTIIYPHIFSYRYIDVGMFVYISNEQSK